MQQLALFDIGTASRKTRPGPGAFRLYWFMRHISCGKPYCYPKQKFLQDKMRRKRQTIYRWIKELIDFGFLEVVRRGREGLSKPVQIHRSSTRQPIAQWYQECYIQPYCTYCTVYEARPPSGGERTPQIASQVAEYFGNAELGGKRADPALISRVARLVKDSSGFERFKNYLGALGKTP